MVASPDHLESLEQASRSREALPLQGRALAVEAGVAAGFGVAAGLLAAFGGDGRVHWGVAAVLVVSFAVALRAQFDVGAGYVPPTQLVFVPVLFLEPARIAPLIALAGWLLGRLPDLVRGEVHPTRLALKVPSNCWFAIGPAAVLVLAGSPPLSWDDWPLYLAALAAQFLGDLGSGTIREWLELGVPPSLHVRGLAYVWFVDAALSPIGLLAAFASLDHRYAFLAVLPLALLFALFSSERTRRFEAEREGTRAREAMIAGASHELQTPLAVLSGLVDALARSPDLPLERRAESYAAMRRQTGQLRELVGQFIDYTRLKAGQPLAIEPRPTDVAEALRAVAELWESDVRAEGEARLCALVDPARLHGVLMALVSNALKHGPPEGPVLLTARRDATRVAIEVADGGPGLAEDRLEAVFEELQTDADRAEGSGLGLFLARTAMRAQDGDVWLRSGAGAGLVAVVELPACDLPRP